ncbi:CRISPR-associated endoribonuclease Cas6 [Aneurinibacillus uraniidurans]|uniref:CRISPR-associated endoribonuclease Cas6 n=1 Tax=Aneurinibacillus uraniidurans TaxID=2966586 RepID=UPI00234B6440|nr:CRISPR-associated endoribonuclease Cas6 [Aneurinibacillus sp. B1]WCN36624.1 CRISPR-associated endoribonuclease Cas6 [Aneurinibacillus sp. B1]
MVFEQLTVTVFLRKNIHFSFSSEKIGQWINAALYLDENLKVFHEQNQYKHYVFDNLYPFEKDGVYKEGKVYIYKIRSLKQGFLSKVKHLLKKVNDDNFQLLAAEITRMPQRPIQELYTVTPFFITVKGAPWFVEHDWTTLEERLQANAEKKYKNLFGEERFTHSFIQRIEILNQRPIAISYKGIKLLGNKAKITIQDDQQSQKLAFISMGSGLAEKNSAVGGGFCLATYI